jgi:hypothetical protein
VNLIFDIVDFNFSYDSVDKAILANPHTFNRIPYSVEKCLSSAATTIDTYAPRSSASGKFPIYQADLSVNGCGRINDRLNVLAIAFFLCVL